MSPWFYVGYPVLMIVVPSIALFFWRLLTGVGRLLPALLATLALLVAFGASVLLFGPSAAGRVLHYNPWAIGGFLVLLLGFVLPQIRGAFSSLPETPRSASLRPRRLELSRGAFVWPFAAWAAITTGLLFSVRHPLAWLGPAVGLLCLAILKPCLLASVREPEPLGGADPAGLSEQYAVFRKRRARIMYWMGVTLSLLATSMWLLPLGGRAAAWIGSIGGPLLGLSGGFFGVWADAQRYLLRRQLSGAEPPGRIPA